MKRLVLNVNSLGTDAEGEQLPYEVQIGDAVINGVLLGHTREPYRRVIGQVRDGTLVALNTPDVRLSLSVED